MIVREKERFLTQEYFKFKNFSQWKTKPNTIERVESQAKEWGNVFETH